MDRRETERLLEAIARAREAGEPAALATVVRVRGSAYRREGARMFVRRDRSFECALSGGCLEHAVAEAASHVIDSGQPVVINYDLQDDSVWSLGIGCTGAVDIRIERLESDPLTLEWLAALERGVAAVLVTPLAGVSGRMILYGNGDVSGGLSDPEAHAEAMSRAAARLVAAYPRSGCEQVHAAEVFFDVAAPPPALVIFGAGHDAPPVAQMAWALGFSVVVVDVREAFLTTDRFPDASLVCAHFSEFAARVTLPPGSFTLVMNHHLDRDRESLRFALESDCSFIGVLGPRPRFDRLLADLVREGVVPSAASLSRVRSPVGLALGAESPAEVAVSIVGEMLAVLRGFAGGFLSGTAGSLHVPAASRLFARS
jgi:xanthine/CO dehydrogenase XdhC/CoxF family maturation factor